MLRRLVDPGLQSQRTEKDEAFTHSPSPQIANVHAVKARKKKNKRMNDLVILELICHKKKFKLRSKKEEEEDPLVEMGGGGDVGDDGAEVVWSEQE